MTEGKEWRCAFCCHVRTGTIIFGIWHLMLHVVALSVIAVILMHPELVSQPDDGMDPSVQLDSESEATPGQLCDYQSEYSLMKERRWTSQDVYIGLAVTLCSFSLSILMVYGAVKGIPRYLLPFFFLQIFDFGIACITMLGSVVAVGDIRGVLSSWSTLPYHQQIIHISSQWLGAILLISFILAMLLKAYLIYVVWYCYKYLLKMKKEKAGLAAGDSDSQMLLPPDYETATKDSSFVPVYSTPPPPYSPQQAP